MCIRRPHTPYTKRLLYFVGCGCTMWAAVGSRKGSANIQLVVVFCLFWFVSNFEQPLHACTPYKSRRVDFPFGKPGRRIRREPEAAVENTEYTNTHTLLRHEPADGQRQRVKVRAKQKAPKTSLHPRLTRSPGDGGSTRSPVT